MLRIREIYYDIKKNPTYARSDERRKEHHSRPAQDSNTDSNCTVESITNVTKHHREQHICNDERSLHQTNLGISDLIVFLKLFQHTCKKQISSSSVVQDPVVFNILSHK